MPDSAAPATLQAVHDFRKTREGFGAAVEAPAPALPSAPATPGSGSPSMQRTLLGIATPGIAPLAGALPPPPPTTPLEAPAPELADFPIPPPPRLPSRTTRAHRPVWPWAALAIVGAAALGGALALFTKKSPQVSVTAFELTPDGADNLVLRCEACAAQAKLAIGKQVAPLVDGSARLRPPQRLHVGTNELEVSVLDATGSVVETVKLAVPIAFRVETSLEGRHASPPFAEIVLQVPAGSRVEIGGVGVALVDGRASSRYELSEAHGESRTEVAVSREVPVAVIQGSGTKNTVARIQATVTRLELNTPAQDHVLVAGPLVVSGTSSPGATIQAGELTTTAGSQGEFSLTVPSPVAGLLRLRAETPDKVTRSLEVRLLTEAENTPLPLGPFQVGGNIEASGTVVESRISHDKTTLLLETSSGQPMGVVFGQRLTLPRGRSVRVRGQVLSLEPLKIRASQIQ
jgi:hypothetical protein